MRKTLLLCFLTLVGVLAFGQTNFNGTIRYKMIDTGAAANMLREYIPSQINIYHKNGEVSQFFEGGVFNNVRFIFPANKEEAIIIIDSIKTYNKVTLAEVINAGNYKKTIKNTSESEIILGHNCLKYSVSDGVTSYPSYVWIAMDIPVTSSEILNLCSSDYFQKEIPFAVLKIETTAGLHYVAIEINAEMPDDQLFNIPKGYKWNKKLFEKKEKKKKK